MVADFTAERRAAGASIPQDALDLLASIEGAPG